MTAIGQTMKQPSSGVPTVGAVPLTQAQDGLWYGQRLDPTNPIYNTGEYIEIRGALDLARFACAVDGTLAEADALALVMADTADGPRQWVDRHRRPRLEVVDLTDEPDPPAMARSAMATDMMTPIDPCVDPLACQRLYRLAEDHFYWYERAHHLATDAWGQALVNTRVAQRYAELGGGTAAGLLLAPYADWLAEDRAYRGSEREAEDAAFWRAAFPAEPAIADMATGSGAAITAHTRLACSLDLPQAFDIALAALSERVGVSWPDVLTALAAAYLCRHAGAHETVIGVPYMGRLGRRAARVPATVMNVLPLAIKVDERAPLGEFLVSAARAARAVRRHGRYRSEQLRRDLGLLGGGKRLYGPSVNVLPFDDNQLELPGLVTVRHTLGNGPVDDLTVTFRADSAGRGVRVELDANPGRYQMDGANGLQAHLARLSAFLEASVTSGCLADVPTLTSAETRHWVFDVNASAHAVPHTTLVTLIERAMRAYPASPAVRFNGRTLTYAELDQASGRLAAALAAEGVGRGDFIAVAMPRSIELVVALLGTLRAGAAYLPLDIDHPRERVATIISAARPRMALTGGSGAAVLPDALPAWRLDRKEAVPEAVQAASAPEAPRPHDAAYVIYTSGSTGMPKGVVIEHDAIVNRLLWMQAHYGIGTDERVLQKTPDTFDVSVWEFFLPLMSGALLVVAPPDAHKDPVALARLMLDERITTLHFVPSMLALFLAEPEAQAVKVGGGLRRVFCSGEALPAELRDRFHQVVGGVGGAELHNLYGPTEAAVDVSWWPAGPDDHSQPVPIGYPVWNTRLYVLDEFRRPLPPGCVGNLYLAGRQLARGYLGRPDLTAERFVPDPFVAGERMYVTGDLARWREDGAVDFLGRSDFQIKIRGQRVELGEIESVIARVPDIAAAAVIVREDRPGDQRIVAYVVETAPVADDVLRQAISSRLPEYMIPAAFVRLSALPVTSNGKLDRKALPEPAFTGRAGRVPAAGTETQVAELFAQVLGRQGGVSADDDFFDLGGHSLLAARLMLDIREQWGHAVGLGTLFAHPTVARLAGYIDSLDASVAKVGTEGFGEIMTLAPIPTGATQLPGLFCVHPAGGLSWCYGGIARALVPARRVEGLQSPTLDAAVPFPATLNDMAKSYVDTVTQLQPTGPYHLLGWSVGGIIAQAMAVELVSRGLPVGAVVMLDAYPADVWRDRPEPAAEAALKALLHIAEQDPGQFEGAPTREEVIALLRRVRHPLGSLADELLDGVIRVVDGNNRLVREHRHRRYDGPVLYFRAALDHADDGLVPESWLPYVGRLDVHDIATVHAHLVGVDAVKAMAPVLNATLGAADGAGSDFSAVQPSPRLHSAGRMPA